MTQFLRPYLTVPEIEALGGEYEGIVAVVSETETRNRFTGKKSTEPMIEFLDRKRLILNKTLLRACIAWFGKDSHDWTGRRLRLFLRRVESVDRATGETRVRVQRALLCDDVYAKTPIKTTRGRAPEALTREPGEDTEVDADSAVASVGAGDDVLTAADIFERGRVR